MWEIWTSVLTGIVLCCIIFSMVIWWKNSSVGSSEEHTSWQKVGTLGALYLYPIKSGRALLLNEAMATTLGLKEIQVPGQLPMRDRFLVVYRGNTGEMVSAKKLTGLVHLTARSTGQDTIEIMYPEYESLQFRLPMADGENTLVTIKMWGQNVPSVDCGNEVAKWLCEVTHKGNGEEESGLRMGYWSEAFTERRDVSVTKYSKLYKKLRNEDTGAYSDLSSYLLLNQTSVNDLKSRLDPSGDCQVSALNFRPNLVVEGVSIPYDEDKWEWIRIGESAVFRNFKPCTRCSVTTIDPQTGIRDSQLEPLKTLRKYRQLEDPALREAENNSPVMGVYIGVYQEGIVKIGDPIFVAYPTTSQ